MWIWWSSWFQGAGSEGGVGYYGGGGGGGGWGLGRGSGCPGGGGGGSTTLVVCLCPPQGFIQALNQSSGTGGNQGRFYLDGIDPL